MQDPSIFDDSQDVTVTISSPKKKLSFLALAVLMLLAVVAVRAHRAGPTQDLTEIPMLGSAGSNDCDCDYSSGGCKIVDPAPVDKACQCKYKGFWTCGGDVVDCWNPSLPLCNQPDTSSGACMLGGGDCGGYYDGW